MKDFLIILVICGAMVASARAQSPDTEAAGSPAAAARPEAPAPSAPLRPEPPREEPATGAAPLIEPPSAAPQPAPSATQPSPATTQEKQRAGFFDIRITDVVMGLFAAMLVLLMFKLWRATSGLWAAAQAQLGDNRSAILAGERVAEAAARSAEAALEAVTAMRESADRKTRAYVTAKQFLQGPSRDDKQKLLGWLFQVVWENSGATPTTGFRYRATIRTFENRIPADFDYAPPTATSFAGGELGSGSSTASGTVFLAQKEIASMKNGTRKAILYGEAQYSDVFEQAATRNTRFCVELVVIGEANGAHPTPFTFVYHPKNNFLS